MNQFKKALETVGADFVDVVKEDLFTTNLDEVSLTFL